MDGILKELCHRKKMEKNQTFEYHGQKYTINELYEIRIEKSLTHDQIENRILHHHWDIERAITQPNNVKKQPFGIKEGEFEYQGKLYNSYQVWLMRKNQDLTMNDISDRLHNGWSVEMAITQPRKITNQKFEYNGKLYTSKELAELSIYDLTHNDITSRINRCGWSVEKAVTTPKNPNCQHKHTSQSAT